MIVPWGFRGVEAGMSDATLIEKTREQEILEELGAFFDLHIGAMTPSQLEEFERKSEEIMEQARLRSSESA
jgi:hypothetical protein